MDVNQAIRDAMAFASRIGMNEEEAIAVAEEWLYCARRSAVQLDRAALEQYLARRMGAA